MDVVNIVKLPKMKMASFHAIGEKPEIIAFAKLQEWAFPKGIFNEELVAKVHKDWPQRVYGIEIE